MLSDLRLTLRTLRKSPGFVIVAVFTLALGIGVNGAMFGIVNAVMLRGLPYRDSSQLLAIGSRNLHDNISRMGLSHADFADLRARQRSCEDLAAYDPGKISLSNAGEDPVRLEGCRLTVGVAKLLRARAALGRWFIEGEDRPGAAPAVVLGDSLWRNSYGADPAIIGRQMKVDGKLATVVGVAEPDFHFPEIANCWVPLRVEVDDWRGNRSISGLARLRAGTTVAQVVAEYSGLMQQLATAHPDTNKNVEPLVRTLHDSFIDEGTRRMVSIMFGAVLLVLLIACANIANLLLARAAARQREIAVRVALGAGRGRIVRLLLTEALLLAGGGALLGLPLAQWLLGLLNAYLKVIQIPFWMVFDVDWAGLAFIAGAALLSSVVAGLWPAWLATRPNLNAVLKDGGRGATGFSLSKFTRLLVIGEVMMSCVLLVLAGLAIRTVVKVEGAPLGFSTFGIFTNRIDLHGAAYGDMARQSRFFHDLMERLSARPEVSGTAISDMQPIWVNHNQIQVQGRPRGGAQGSGVAAQWVSRMAVSGGYFDLLDIKLAQGRVFDERDTADSPRVVIVSTRFAERHWPGENALGQHLVYGDGANVKPGDWMTVIGVVANTLQGDFDPNDRELPQTYLPYTQNGWVGSMTVYTKARTGDGAALATTVRRTVHDLDSELPIFWPRTLDDMMGQARFFKILFGWIFGLFGVVALVLAAVGLYGVMSYSVSQRTAEIGVRMALGAQSRDVVALILWEGGGRLLIGLGLGLVASHYLGRLLAFVLWGIEPSDPVAFVSTVAILGGAGLIACLVPALRALRVNPIEALRCD